MTPISYRQLQWLRQLERKGTAYLPSKTGFTCMKRSWTEWVPDQQPSDCFECLTDDGREVLRQHRLTRLKDLK